MYSSHPTKTNSATSEALVGIDIGGRIVYGTPETIEKIVKTKAELEAKSHLISQDLKGHLPSSRTNQFAGWQGQCHQCRTTDETVEAKLWHLINKGHFSRKKTVHI